MNFFKWTALGVGGVVAVAHIGVLGHIIKATKVPEAPVINFPRGDYSSYKIEAGKEGYSIEYKANDPAILESQKSLSLDKEKKGFLVVVLRIVVNGVKTNSLWMALEI